MRKDYLIATVAGIVTVFFAFFTLKNAEIGGPGLLVSLFIIVPVLWIIGITIGRFLAKWLPVFYQLAKFAIVGFLNTSIDFGVLNLISMFTGVTAGFLIGGVNVPGFILAAVNSYFWNKFWVFRRPSEALAKEGKQKADYSDFLTFILVILIGAFINGIIVIFLTTFIDPLFNLTPERWLNVSKVFATAVSLIWNFLGFKFLVFKKK